MKEYISTETFNNMQVAFNKVLESKGSITELKEAMANYANLPTICKYFSAKFFIGQVTLKKPHKLWIGFS